MNTIELKTRVKEMIDDTDDDVLEQVYALLKQAGQNDWTAEDIRIYNKEIDEAMKRMDEGKYTLHEDVEKESELWFINEK